MDKDKDLIPKHHPFSFPLDHKSFPQIKIKEYLIVIAAFFLSDKDPTSIRDLVGIFRSMIKHNETHMISAAKKTIDQMGCLETSKRARFIVIQAA